MDNSKRLVNQAVLLIYWATVLFASKSTGMLHKQPSLTVDAVVLDDKGRLLLVRRKRPPFQGRCALPGGFVDCGETVEAAVKRELYEETGLAARSLELIGVHSDPRRDPRGHTVSIAFLVEARTTRPEAGDDAAAVEFAPTWRTQKLAFDHDKIVTDALRLRKAGRRGPR